MADAQSLKELIGFFLKTAPCQKKVATALVRLTWKKVMPQMIVNRTEQIYIKNRKLFIKTNSAPLRQELQLNKALVRARLQENIPQYSFEHIVFL